MGLSERSRCGSLRKSGARAGAGPGAAGVVELVIGGVCRVAVAVPSTSGLSSACGFALNWVRVGSSCLLLSVSEEDSSSVSGTNMGAVVVEDSVADLSLSPVCGLVGSSLPGAADDIC